MKLAVAMFAAFAIGALGLASLARNDAPSAASQSSAVAVKLTVSVEGVSCASCTLSIRRALKKVDGVKSVQAGSEPNQAVVTYDPGKVKPQQIVQIIDELGFKTRTVSNG